MLSIKQSCIRNFGFTVFPIENPQNLPDLDGWTTQEKSFCISACIRIELYFKTRIEYPYHCKTDPRKLYAFPFKSHIGKQARNFQQTSMDLKTCTGNIIFHPTFIEYPNREGFNIQIEMDLIPEQRWI